MTNCTTRQEVAGSIPDGVIGIFRLTHLLTLEST